MNNGNPSMTEPVSFVSTTPRFGLPLLFQGQAQKEFFVNEAFALVDALLHPTVKGQSAAPPNTPIAGDCWLVGPDPSGAWSERADSLACFTGSGWLLVAPRLGMRAFDLSLGQIRIYSGTWIAIPSPASPQGGSVIDTEARNSLDQVITALKSAGIFSPA